MSHRSTVEISKTYGFDNADLQRAAPAFSAWMLDRQSPKHPYRCATRIDIGGTI